MKTLSNSDLSNIAGGVWYYTETTMMALHGVACAAHNGGYWNTDQHDAEMTKVLDNAVPIWV